MGVILSPNEATKPPPQNPTRSPLNAPTYLKHVMDDRCYYCGQRWTTDGQRPLVYPMLLGEICCPACQAILKEAKEAKKHGLRVSARGAAAWRKLEARMTRGTKFFQMGARRG